MSRSSASSPLVSGLEALLKQSSKNVSECDHLRQELSSKRREQYEFESQLAALRSQRESLEADLLQTRAHQHDLHLQITTSSEAAAQGVHGLSKRTKACLETSSIEIAKIHADKEIGSTFATECKQKADDLLQKVRQMHDSRRQVEQQSEQKKLQLSHLQRLAENAAGETAETCSVIESSTAELKQIRAQTTELAGVGHHVQLETATETARLKQLQSDNLYLVTLQQDLAASLTSSEHQQSQMSAQQNSEYSEFLSSIGVSNPHNEPAVSFSQALDGVKAKLNDLQQKTGSVQQSLADVQNRRTSTAQRCEELKAQVSIAEHRLEMLRTSSRNKMRQLDPLLPSSAIYGRDKLDQRIQSVLAETQLVRQQVSTVVGDIQELVSTSGALQKKLRVARSALVAKREEAVEQARTAQQQFAARANQVEEERVSNQNVTSRLNALSSAIDQGRIECEFLTRQLLDEERNLRGLVQLQLDVQAIVEQEKRAEQAAQRSQAEHKEKLKALEMARAEAEQKQGEVKQARSLLATEVETTAKELQSALRSKRAEQALALSALRSARTEELRLRRQKGMQQRYQEMQAEHAQELRELDAEIENSKMLNGGAPEPEVALATSKTAKKRATTS